MRRAARRWPWAGVAWWKTSRTCPVKVGDFDTDMRLICREGLTEAFLLSLEGIHRRDLDTGAKLFAALGQPVLMHGARPTRDQVHSSGPWDDPPLEWSTMPVSSRGPGGVGPGDATRLSSTPSTRTPAKTGRVIRCGSQTRLDTGPHGIPRGATYPASLKPPEPCRAPGPGCVDRLHHHTPVALSKSPRNPGSQPAGCTTQHQAPEYLGCEPRSSDGSLPNRRADHTDQATQSSR